MVFADADDLGSLRMKRRTGHHASPLRRTILLAAVALAFASAQSPLLAATDPSWEKFTADTEALWARCEMGSASRQMVGEGYNLTSIRTTTEWTGSCVKGKRDGHGVLSSREETRDNLKNTLSLGLSSATRQEVTFVAGVPIGLRCVGITTYTDGVESSRSDLGCDLAGVSGGRESYRKTSDGRWRQAEFADNLEPPIFLAPGTLEAVSERLVADARAGNAAGPVKLDAQATALEDVLKDGKYVRLMDGQSLNLGTRRVAVVLTGHALAEIDRFRKMRQAFIDQSAHGKAAPGRAEFINNSDPAKLLGGIAAPLRGNVKNVVPADDLTPLTDGSADYALVVDWSFSGNFALSPKEFEALPLCDDYGPKSRCAVLFAQSAHAWLFDPKLDVVRSYMVGYGNPITTVGISDRKYARLFDKLAMGFDVNLGVDNVANMLSWQLAADK